MLISKKDIASIQPPLLMQTPNGSWKLVLKVIAGSTFDIEIIEKDKKEFNTRMISQIEPPFYIGEDVWELDYGATLVTLKHASLAGHPAQQLWEDWLVYKQQFFD